MNVLEAIAARRSVRAYADKPVARETVEQLLAAAVQAPTAMNSQHFAFGVIRGRERLAEIGERARLALLAEFDRRGVTGGFRDRVADPSTSIFYGAGTLIVIYGPAGDDFAAINCSLAAENLMLAATEMGLGTCWIGMAMPLFNDPAFKAEIGVPEELTVVAPIIVGYPEGEMPAGPKKNPPKVLFWEE
jgi:nitroreductase